VKTWIAGARPRTLPAAISPVAVGTGVAWPTINLAHALLALVVALALQVGVNYANDYSDGIRGTDQERVGPLRLVASGTKSASAVKAAAFSSFGVAALAGFGLAARSSWWLIAVGVAAIVSAWRYTGGRSPYGYRGLGEIFVFIFFGPVAVVGTTFVQTGRLSALALAASVPVGLLICAVLVINNLRDRQTDLASSKRTLAVRVGDRLTRALFVYLVLAPFVGALGLVIARPWSALTLLALPQAIWLTRFVAAGAQGSDLVRGLGRTGQLLLSFSALLTLGLVL
jgi:1,4-dihydroxy-2-naphthoate polyprenyltransferase